MSENQKNFKFDKRAASYDDGFEGKFLRCFALIPCKAQ